MTTAQTTERVKIHTITTHVRPHIDEIVALWLLKEFGQTRYTGLRTAKLEFRKGDNSNTTTANTVVDLEEQGIIAIGIGNGRFDEHKKGRDVPEDQCAATLVAQFLGIKDDPALKQILKFTLNNDRKGAAHPFDIAGIIKAMYEQHPNNPMKAVKWALAAISAKYAEQFAFHNGTVEEFAKAKIVEIDFYDNKIRLAIVESDDTQFSKYARSQGIAIIIQKNSSGNVQIFTNKTVAAFRLFDVARILRHAEQQRRSAANPVTDWKELAAAGMLANCGITRKKQKRFLTAVLPRRVLSRPSWIWTLSSKR